MTLGLSDNVNGKRYIITSPKTLKSNRILPLSKKFIDDLKALKESVMQYTNFREDWFVFGNQLPLGDDAIRRRKNKILELQKVAQYFFLYFNFIIIIIFIFINNTISDIILWFFI